MEARNSDTVSVPKPSMASPKAWTASRKRVKPRMEIRPTSQPPPSRPNMLAPAMMATPRAAASSSTRDAINLY